MWRRVRVGRAHPMETDPCVAIGSKPRCLVSVRRRGVSVACDDAFGGERALTGQSLGAEYQRRVTDAIPAEVALR